MLDQAWPEGNSEPVNIPVVRAKLVQVEDKRFGTKFDPPIIHLGQPITDGRPSVIARMCLDYQHVMLKEAIDLAA